MIPEILTARLRLRGHRLEDFPSSAAMWADRDVTRFIGGRPLSEEEAWARFLRYAGHWSIMSFGYWAVEERDGGAFIGEVGFANFKREIDPAIRDIPEVGWVLVRSVHGRGYATEAVAAALVWARTNLAAQSTTCLIHPENLASIRVADKCGFNWSREAVYKNEPVVIYTRKIV